MKRVLLLGALALVPVLAGCTGGGGDIAIRARPQPLAEGVQSAAFRVAEANSHFALGNVALALQGFRAAYREDPANVDALNGMAACYDKMGRFDLSRGYYEQALALAPHDRRLYANLATSLDLQGRAEDAARVRAEMADRMTVKAGDAPQPMRTAQLEPSLTPVPATPAPAPANPSPVEPAATVTVALAPPEPAAAPPPPALQSGPRLERVSLAEVELVTRPRPAMAQQRRPARQATVTLVAPPPRVTLLNAARRQGLAARTRASLQRQGWRNVAIGNAEQVLRQSVVSYPAHRRAEAMRLLQQFDFAVRHRQSRDGRITLILGQDAATAQQRSRGA